MDTARLTIFAGHYGSGKTSLAMNYAVYLKKALSTRRVVIADLDIVNPYFRTIDGKSFFYEHGVELISTEYAGSNLDAPAIPGQAVMMFDDKSITGVIDLGGDDRGAYALGRYSERIEAEKSKNILLVVNRCRPLSATPEAVAEYRSEIEHAAGVKFTGIVNNTNLGKLTKAEDVIDSEAYAQSCSELTGLPLVMTAVRQELEAELNNVVDDLFSIKIISKWTF